VIIDLDENSRRYDWPIAEDRLPAWMQLARRCLSREITYDEYVLAITSAAQPPARSPHWVSPYRKETA
jgi:hypothetical protein